MPMHDWSRIPSGLFHDFHQTWTIQIKMALNSGILPKGISALVEQRGGRWESDDLATKHNYRLGEEIGGAASVAAAPVVQFMGRTSKQVYATRANRVVVKHRLGQTVAVLEIVSPDNKDSRAALRDFVEKMIDFLRAGIHVLVVDLFPPTPRDPFGLHKIIWDEIEERDFAFPGKKNRILASYETGKTQAFYVEPVAVGDVLPSMPLFLASGWHVPVPLESTYETTWNASPEDFRRAVETGVLPGIDEE
ncbi:hypothetical protein BH10PLA2_BH10PLA2_03680 [soil metagenome]